MAAHSGELSTWMYNNPAYSIKGSLPFELGKSYPRRDGKMVKIIAVNNCRGYETVQGDDGETPEVGFRYNRESDRGRCTGTYGDFSDPRNLLPEFSLEIENSGEGFLIAVSLLSGGKTAEEKAKFIELAILCSQVEEIKRAARKTDDWACAHGLIFNPTTSCRIFVLIKELEFSFPNLVPTPSYRDAVISFEDALEKLMYDKRPFYL